MADSIQFNREPYKVRYRNQEGNRKTIQRRPPPKLHEALPKDVVQLTRRQNAAFDSGGEYKVKHIDPRHPNVLQLENDEGRTTFVEYYDTVVEEQVALRDGMDPRDRPARNKYLNWP